MLSPIALRGLITMPDDLRITLEAELCLHRRVICLKAANKDRTVP